MLLKAIKTCTPELTDRHLGSLMTPLICSNGKAFGFINKEVLLGSSRGSPAHLRNMVRCVSAFHPPVGVLGTAAWAGGTWEGVETAFAQHSHHQVLAFRDTQRH